jgi:hypothetical protein
MLGCVAASNSSARRLANFASWTVITQHGGCYAAPGTALNCGIDLRYYPPPYTSSTDLDSVTGASSGACMVTGSSTTRYSSSGDGLVSYQHLLASNVHDHRMATVVYPLQAFTFPCYMVNWSTTGVETGSAQRAVAMTNLAMGTSIVKINLPAYSGGAVYSAVHITVNGAFYVAGSTSPFLALVTPAGSYSQVLDSVASKLAINSNTLYASIGKDVGFVGTRYSLPSGPTAFTAIATHTEAIRSFQVQDASTVWVCSASGIMAYKDAGTPPLFNSATSFLPGTSGCSDIAGQYEGGVATAWTLYFAIWCTCE